MLLIIMVNTQNLNPKYLPHMSLDSRPASRKY